jgi:sigma-B regulation protein RsbU (phosphoserine phosphatase)
MPDASSPRYCQSLPGLNRLLEVTRLLAQEVDTAKVLDAITLEATKALHCDRAILYQFDEKRSVLFATSGTSEEVVVPLDRGIAGHVARQRMMANIADAPRHALWDAAYDKIAGYQTQTVLAVPLVAARDGRLLGVLEMLNNAGGPFDSDDEALALAFSAHASAALDRARLVESLQQQRELEASLQVAREVQRRFMPSRLPTLAGYEVATWWYPNQAVGGDYCDVISLPSGESILTIADVSGHGLGPSLLMASVRAALRTLLLDQTSPQVLLERLALALADDFEQGSFVTMCLAKLAPESHTLTYSNAGHGPALVYRAATGLFEEASSTGLPLGVVVPTDYPEGPPIVLAPGDLFFLATDGIVESFDRRGQQFGVERLMQLITRLAQSPITEMVRTIGREVQLHYVGDSPPDDLTILALRRSA